jgi:hypothetical protein
VLADGLAEIACSERAPEATLVSYMPLGGERGVRRDVLVRADVAQRDEGGELTGGGVRVLAILSISPSAIDLVSLVIAEEPYLGEPDPCYDPVSVSAPMDFDGDGIRDLAIAIDEGFDDARHENLHVVSSRHRAITSTFLSGASMSGDIHDVATCMMPTRHGPVLIVRATLTDDDDDRTTCIVAGTVGASGLARVPFTSDTRIVVVDEHAFDHAPEGELARKARGLALVADPDAPLFAPCPQNAAFVLEQELEGREDFAVSLATRIVPRAGDSTQRTAPTAGDNRACVGVRD